MTGWNDPDELDGEPEEEANEPSDSPDVDDEADDDVPNTDEDEELDEGVEDVVVDVEGDEEDDAEGDEEDDAEGDEEDDAKGDEEDDAEGDEEDDAKGEDVSKAEEVAEDVLEDEQSADYLPTDDDLEDEFADFIDEELGYAEIDWDTLPQADVDEHERLRGMTHEELDGVDLSEMSDFARWAVARAYLACGDEVAFESAGLPLLSSKDRSAALDYVDITLALISRKAKREDFESAFALLDQLAKISNGDDALVRRFRGILTIQKGELEEGLELLAQLAETRPDDPSFLLSLGEDLCGIGLWEEAVEYLEIAEEQARQASDQDLLSSIENAVQFAQRQMGFDDVEDF